MIRKILVLKETVYADGGREAIEPVTRTAGIAIIENPCAGRYEADLASMFDIGAELAERLLPEMGALLARPAIAYGKAALVGVHGELEHAAALLHPKMG